MFKNFIKKLETSFVSAEIASSTRGRGAIAGSVTGIAGLALGTVAVSSIFSTAGSLFSVVASALTLNPIGVVLFGVAAVLSGVIANLTARGTVWLLGTSKGAFADRKPAAVAAPVAAPVVEAPAPAITVQAPVTDGFNNAASPEATVQPVQPPVAAPKGPDAAAP